MNLSAFNFFLLLLLVLISLYLCELYPLLVKTTSDRWCVMVFRQLPQQMTRDAIQLNHSIHSPPQVSFAPLSCTKRVFPPPTTQNCFTQTCFFCTSSLFPRYTSRTVQYQMLVSTSGRQQAELNWCQAWGLWPHLSIRNFPSWQQQVSGVVQSSLANPAVRSGQDSAGGVPGGAQGGSGEEERCLWGTRKHQAWGTRSTCALVSAKGPLTHGSHPAAHGVGVPEPATPSHPPHSTSPAVSALQPIAVVKLRVWHETAALISLQKRDVRLGTVSLFDTWIFLFPESIFAIVSSLWRVTVNKEFRGKTWDYCE